MQVTSPRESAGFRMFAASRDPSAEPAPMSTWSSSMKAMISGFSLSSFRIALRRSSNWPRYLVPATTSDRSSATIRRSASWTGTRPDAMRCARPSTIAVFPTPGSPSNTGLFFVRRRRIWTMRSTSSSRPTNGSKPPVAANSVRSRPNSASAVISLLPFLASRSRQISASSSRAAGSESPCAASALAAAHDSRRRIASRRCSFPTAGWPSTSASCAARSRTRRASSASGSSPGA